MGVLCVEILDQLHHHLHRVPRVLIFHHGEVWVVEGWYKMVLQAGVGNPALVVNVSLILVLLEEAPLLPGRRP